MIRRPNMVLVCDMRDEDWKLKGCGAANGARCRSRTYFRLATEKHSHRRVSSEVYPHERVGVIHHSRRGCAGASFGTQHCRHLHTDTGFRACGFTREFIAPGSTQEPAHNVAPSLQGSRLSSPSAVRHANLSARPTGCLPFSARSRGRHPTFGLILSSRKHTFKSRTKTGTIHSTHVAAPGVEENTSLGVLRLLSVLAWQVYTLIKRVK